NCLRLFVAGAVDIDIAQHRTEHNDEAAHKGKGDWIILHEPSKEPGKSLAGLEQNPAENASREATHHARNRDRNPAAAERQRVRRAAEISIVTHDGEGCETGRNDCADNEAARALLKRAAHLFDAEDNAR